jgi:hypothetical protein
LTALELLKSAGWLWKPQQSTVNCIEVADCKSLKCKNTSNKPQGEHSQMSSLKNTIEKIKTLEAEKKIS